MRWDFVTSEESPHPFNSILGDLRQTLAHQTARMRAALLVLGLLHAASGLSTSRQPLPATLARLRGGQAAPATKLPGDVYDALAAKGQVNAELAPIKTLHQAFMGGMYVAIGGIFSLVVAGAMPGLGPDLQRCVVGLIFPIGLIFILQAAGQLMTGNFALVTAAWYEGKISLPIALRSFALSGFGNLCGCLTMAKLIKSAGLLKGGAADLVAATALKKCSIPAGQVLIRATLCNWLVSMAIFLAVSAADLPGKIFGIWSCIPMFVGIGLEHSVANMFFLPLGKMAGADISVADIVMKNIIFVTLGNLLGAGGLLAGGMSFQFGALGGK